MLHDVSSGMVDPGLPQTRGTAGTTDTGLRLRTSLVRGAITLALPSGTVWPILGDRGLAPLPRAAAEHGERIVRTHAAGPVADEAAQGQTRRRLRGGTAAGEPAAGMALTSRPGTGTAPLEVTTDTAGLAALYDICAAQRRVVRSDLEWQVWTPRFVGSTQGDTTQTTIVATTCGGPVRGLDQDGSLLVSRFRWTGGLQRRWNDLDEPGPVDIVGRRCGRTQVRHIDLRGHAERRSMLFDVVGRTGGWA